MAISKSRQGAGRVAAGGESQTSQQKDCGTAPIAPKSRKSNPNRGSKPGERRGGRKPGTPNKATYRAREAIAAFVEDNTERLQSWLDEIYEQDGPQSAFKCFTDLVEYHVPKLTRREHVDSDGNAVPVQRIEIVAGDNSKS